MAEWGETLGALRRRLVARAAQVTAQLRGRSGVPDPDDLAQEVVTRLLSTYGETELRTWPVRRLHGLANRALHNLVADVARRKPLEVAGVSVSPGDEGGADARAKEPDPERSAMSRELLAIFRECFEAVLDRNEQRFVELSFDLDSAPAAQEKLGWPPGVTEKSRLCHLRTRLVRRVLGCFADRVGGV